jgi:hypothetical protein
MNFWLLDLTKTSFLIFIITQVLYSVFYSIYVMDPTAHRAKMLEGSMFYLQTALFASQILICAVMYEYRVKGDRRATDGYAALKAHIWNSFTNPNMDSEFLVSGNAV